MLQCLQAGNVVIVDSRETWRYEAWHVPGSINIPILYTPSFEIDTKINQIPKGKSVITLCDDYVNCFDARVGGVKIEKAGYTFIERYNKPWELKARL